MKRFFSFLGRHWMVILGMTLSIATIVTFFVLTDGVATLQQIYRSLQYPWLLLAFAFVAAQWVFDAAGLQVLLCQQE